jgi:hypothetical protein
VIALIGVAGLLDPLPDGVPPQFGDRPFPRWGEAWAADLDDAAIVVIAGAVAGQSKVRAPVPGHGANEVSALADMRCSSPASSIHAATGSLSCSITHPLGSMSASLGDGAAERTSQVAPLSTSPGTDVPARMRSPVTPLLPTTMRSARPGGALEDQRCWAAQEARIVHCTGCGRHGVGDEVSGSGMSDEEQPTARRAPASRTHAAA